MTDLPKLGSMVFGCGSLMARLNERRSLEILEAAYETGIRHYDVARSYGYGEAERVLGIFLRRHDDATITTKCGILPPVDRPALRVAKSLARVAVRVAPALRQPLRRRASAQITEGQMDVDALRASVETSRRFLDRDLIDILLLHDAAADDVRDPRIWDFMTEQVSSGRARAWGVALQTRTMAAFRDDPEDLPAVVQFPAAASARSDAHKLDARSRLVIVHSAISVAAALVRGQQPQAVKEGSRRVGADLARPELLFDLCVADTAKRYRDVSVIVASTEPAHLRRNLEIWTGERYPAGDVAAFSQWLQELQPQ